MELTRQERERVRDFRRLLALGWFLMLGPDRPFATRNPAGTLERQARRVLHLLACPRAGGAPSLQIEPFR
ncbi:hypothetical protein Misp01_77740 [Microtetraspora sp. NBRC 13810]|uniref:hypothetical protein n=1 Tax=Microtetraspora sp. NBRC 13810 TaxID=3030990 RepID=UPI00249FF3B1|nr:hypothetical protein [Microtetraspora sp. NBRC 13810]GLW12646.1 hypothetical protein Misp01_77740 [Microtetraspora sp. NBRC 13810]